MSCPVVGTVPAGSTCSSCTVVTTTVCSSTSPASAAIASSRSLNPPPLPSRAPDSSTATHPVTTRSTGSSSSTSTVRALPRALDRARLPRVVGELRRDRAGRTGWLPPAAAPPCRRSSRRPGAAVRTGHCGESGFAFTVAAAFHSSVSASRRAAASAPTKFGMRPVGFGKRAIPGLSRFVHTCSRSAALAASSPASPPASWSCRVEALRVCRHRPASHLDAAAIVSPPLTAHQIRSRPHGSPVHRGRRSSAPRCAPGWRTSSRRCRPSPTATTGTPAGSTTSAGSACCSTPATRASTGPRSTAAAAPRPPSTSSSSRRPNGPARRTSA